MDPYLSGALDGAIGFEPVKADADLVTISHYHIDHSYVSTDLGAPEVVDKTGRRQGCDFVFVPTYHDRCGGCRMGLTQMVSFEMDGIRVAHLGDIGCELTPADVEALGSVDVLFFPTGGVYTLGSADASHVLSRLAPRLAIPIHYDHPRCRLGLEPVDAVLQQLALPQVRANQSHWTSANGLPKDTTLHVLEPAC